MLRNKRPVPWIGRLILPQALLLLAGTFVLSMAPALGQAGERMKVQIQSTADGTDQPCYVILPDGYQPDGDPRPLLVSLHTFSGDVEQRQKEFEAEADKAGWIYLFPHFRGPQQDPGGLRFSAGPAGHPGRRRLGDRHLPGRLQTHLPRRVLGRRAHGHAHGRSLPRALDGRQCLGWYQRPGHLARTPTPKETTGRC